MQFTPDDEYVMIGLQMQYAVHIPFYQVSVKDGKLHNDIYSKILLKQASLDINNNDLFKAWRLFDKQFKSNENSGGNNCIDNKFNK